MLNGNVVLLSQQTRNSFEKIVDLPDFLSFLCEISIDSLDDILKRLVETESIEVDWGENLPRVISLRAKEQESITWFNPTRFDRSSKIPYRQGKAGYLWTAMNTLQVAQIGVAGILQGTSEFLRARTSINGINALADRITPGLSLTDSLMPQFHILAPFPFELSYDHGNGVTLTIPAGIDPHQLRLKAFFLPSANALERPISLEDLPQNNGAFTVNWKPQWPRDSSSAEVRLFYKDKQIDVVAARRWAASTSVRGAVDEYFDPTHKGLGRALKWQQQTRSEEFETAVVRLLNVLGIPAIWYGKGVEPDRPDAAAVANIEADPLILLIECTRENPSAKYSSLAERARQMSEKIGDRTRIIPLVFTPVRVSDTEIVAATDYGVGLVGSAELEHLLDCLTTPDLPTSHVITYLCERAGIPSDG